MAKMEIRFSQDDIAKIIGDYIKDTYNIRGPKLTLNWLSTSEEFLRVDVSDGEDKLVAGYSRT